MNVSNFIRKILALGPLCGLLMAFSVAAYEIPDPYLAQVAVLDQSQKERARAIMHGLSIVLVRVSGSNQSINNKQVRSSLKTPDRYVSEFSYSTPSQEAVTEGAKYGQLAKVRYDAHLVNQLLKDAGLPVWGSNRPDLLVWLAVEDMGGRQVISTTGDLPVKDVLMAEADRRGVPLILPLMDLEDTNNLSYNELWYLFRDKLEVASSRYSPEAVLAGQLYRRADETWSSRWLFLFNATAHGFEIQTDDQNEGVVQALDVAADHLADYYAVSSGESHRIDVAFEILGINSIRDYAQALQYMEEIAMIRQVNLVAVEKDRLILNITADGNLKKLQETIALDSRLNPVQNSVDTLGRERIIYQWRAL